MRASHADRVVPVSSVLTKLSLLLSAALHAALLLLLYVHPSSSPPPEPLRYVEIAPAPPVTAPPARVAAKAPAGKGQRARSNRKSGPADGLSLSDLGIQWKKGQDGVSLPLENGNGSGVAGTEPYGYGSGGSDVLEQMRGTVTYDVIHGRIETALAYPAELVDAGYEGTVHATLIFSKEGRWLRTRSRITSSSRYLRVLVLRTLRQVFAENLPANYFREGLSLRLLCDFQFELERKDNPMDGRLNALENDPTRSGILGNHLYFYRAASLIGQWKIGPLAGYGIAPSIGVDPDWFVDQVSDALSRKAKEDPLEKYRNDPDWEG